MMTLQIFKQHLYCSLVHDVRKKYWFYKNEWFLLLKMNANPDYIVTSIIQNDYDFWGHIIQTFTYFN